MTPQQVMDSCNATLRHRGKTEHFKALATDSRHLRTGALFFALQGPHFDGHNFVGPALRRGATGAIIRKGKRSPQKRKGWIFSVEDPLTALGDVAGYWRRQFSLPVVGITGSNGKTTTKEWIAAILATRYHVLKTEGNFNNLIGLPLTVARLNRRHQIAVLEMGMNVPGEIDRLAVIAAPEIGIITNIGRAHLEGLTSLAGVARAKGELIQRLPTNGLAVLNADDERTLKLARRSPAPVLTFGFSSRAHIKGKILTSDPLSGTLLRVKTPKKEFRVRLNLPGRHNAANALAAIAVGYHFHISPTAMTRALRQTKSLWGRMERINLPNGAIVLNDSYNANPDSMLRAFETLKKINPRYRKFLLLGDMLEIGKQDAAVHREIGRAAARAGIAELVVLGNRATDILAGAERAGLPRKRQHLCTTHREVTRTLRSRLKKNDLLLIKGSRGMKLETIIQDLKGIKAA